MPLKAKTIWEERKQDGESNTLIIRIEKTQVLTDNPPPAVWSRVIQISSPSEDDFGRQIKKRKSIPVDSAVLSDIRQAIHGIEQIQGPKLHQKGATVQIYHEGKSKLVIAYEVPPFVQSRYVIGDGKEIRFIVGDLSDLQALLRKVENAVTPS